MDSTTPSLVIKVIHLPTTVDQQLIVELLQSYQPTEIDLKFAHGFAFLNFGTKLLADIACVGLNGTKIAGKQIVAKYWNIPRAEPANLSKNVPKTSIRQEFQFPAFVEPTGQVILGHLKTNTQFYQAVLLLMWQLNLPPPFGNQSKITTEHEIEQDNLMLYNPTEAVEVNRFRKRWHAESNATTSLPASSTAPSIKDSVVDVKELYDPFGGVVSSGNGLGKTQLEPPKKKHKSVEVEEEDELDAGPTIPISQPKHIDPASKIAQSISPSMIPSRKPNIVFAPLQATPSPESSVVASRSVEIIPFTQHQSSGELGSTPRDLMPIIPITAQELGSNRMTLDELKEHPKFHKWSAGAPSNRLYIKNLASKVSENDLKRIFYRYSKITAPQGTDVEIKLMSKGRLKGQAFITFVDTQTASAALGEVHGFLLYDRPIIIKNGTNPITPTETIISGVWKGIRHNNSRLADLVHFCHQLCFYNHI